MFIPVSMFYDLSHIYVGIIFSYDINDFLFVFSIIDNHIIQNML